MALRKVAYATVVKPDQSLKDWGNTMSRTASSTNLVDKASEILGEAFNPDDYLLTHATIVCSVDTFSPDLPLGSVDYEGEQIERKYADFRITKETEQYINNNRDAFSRSVLLKSYKTFIGAYNFLEHRQVPSESKGKIIDAVVRDIGGSLYVDILVATHLSNTKIIADIKSGKLNALSMGCNITFSICTRCGNVAIDETEMCSHILHEKGSKFIDENGEERIVAELCGHFSIDPTGGVTFIEASWVDDPAFKGAVLRNILSANAVTKQAVEEILSQPPRQWVEDELSKAASQKEGFDFEGDEGGGEEEDSKEDSKDDLGAAVELVKQKIFDRALKEINDKVDAKQEKEKVSDQALTSTNESLLREAQTQVSGETKEISSESSVSFVNHLIMKSASCEGEFLTRIASFHRSLGASFDPMLYKAVQKNPIEHFRAPVEYIQACNGSLGRKASKKEAAFLIRAGQQFRNFRNRNSQE